MKVFTYKNVQLHYEDKGKGHALIFLHGFLEDHEMWAGIIPAFETGYRCIMPDLPCHGKSRFDGDHCSMEFMASAVSALITELDIETATIIGHSMGGYVGLELLEAQKHRLILLNSNFWADPEEKKKDRNRVIELVKKNKSTFIREAIPALFADVNKSKCEEHIQKLIRKANEIPSSEIIAVTKGMRDRKANYELMRHEHISIIQGEMDPIIAPKMLIQELSETGAPVPIKTIPNCGHMSTFEKPRAVVESIKQLLIG